MFRLVNNCFRRDLAIRSIVLKTGWASFENRQFAFKRQSQVSMVLRGTNGGLAPDGDWLDASRCSNLCHQYGADVRNELQELATAAREQRPDANENGRPDRAAGDKKCRRTEGREAP